MSAADDWRFERRNRPPKVAKLVATLDSYPEPVTAEQIERYRVHHWEAVAEQAGVSFPSEATQGLVLATFRRRNVQPRERCDGSGRVFEPSAMAFPGHLTSCHVCDRYGELVETDDGRLVFEDHRPLRREVPA